MKLLSSLILGLALLGTSLFATADELIMIHNPKCPYCQNFMKEVQPGYADTDLGKELPLVIFDLSKRSNDPNFAWVDKAYQEKRWKGFKFTPTFIIWIGDRETGMEKGRLEGYGSVADFYSKLQTAFDRAKIADDAHEQFLKDLLKKEDSGRGKTLSI